MNRLIDSPENQQLGVVPRRRTARIRSGIAVLVIALAGLLPIVATAAPARADTWTVTLTSSATSQWPTRNITLTATSNIDVARSGAHIRIYDQDAGGYVANCTTGTTCSGLDTEMKAGEDYYNADIVDASGKLLAWTGTVYVEWKAVQVSLSASPTTAAVGAASVLTATTSTDLDPSPFYMEIFDVTTTPTWLKPCGYGTTCTAMVSQAVATTHTFRAYVSLYGAYPPPSIQATSNLSFITWANTGWAVTLTTSSYTYSTVLTATANKDVGWSPYSIEIFNDDGSFLASCQNGVSYQMTYNVPAQGAHLVAFVSGTSSPLPPAGTQASSNVLNFGSYKP